MSKIIKPEDTELFGSAKKFVKKPFALSIPEKRKEGNPVDSKQRATNPQTEQTKEETDPADFIEDAKRKARKILSEAEARAAQIRKRECEQGRLDGLGLAKKEIEKEIETSKRVLESLVAELKARESELMQMLSPRLAALATELAGKIIHREIEKDSSIVIAQAQEAINKILEREKLIIRVNPSDQEVMKKHKAALKSMFDGIDKIEVISDPKIEIGGCVVETPLVRVDAQPSSQIETARKTLHGEIEKK